LVYIIKKLKENKLDFFVIGNGSNLLIQDDVLDVAFINLKTENFKHFSSRDNYLVAGAGLTLAKLIDLAYREGLGGIENLAGIPATLGGAIYTNAGTKAGSISERVEKIKGITYSGVEKILPADEINFKYRESALGDFIITEVMLKLEKRNKSEIRRLTEKYLAAKRKNQPLRALSAGCVFKNPAGSRFTSAELIEKAGLKGASRGQVEISKKHANFIINRGGGTFSEVKSLIKMVQERIKMLYNIELETEIEILPR
jgi:UDP-N-acetylmuramate dehydrogenase